MAVHDLWACRWLVFLLSVVAAVGIGAIVCKAYGSPARNGAAGGSELGLLPTGGDDEGNGSVLAIGWKEKSGCLWKMGGGLSRVREKKWGLRCG